jgi:transglutaminase-like putative cysteine protease
MAKLANRAQVDPLTVETAHTIVVPCTPRNLDCYAGAIRRWLGAHFRFVPDATDVETTREPHYLLEQLESWGQGLMTGDCDDVATLGAALGKAVGMNARFMVLGFRSLENAWGHVYAELESDRGWVDLDVTKPRGPVEPPSRNMTFDV